MKKYLFIMAQEGVPWGGSEALCSSAAQHLARRGNDVRVSVKDWGRLVPEVEQLEQEGCRVFPCAYRMPRFFRRQIHRFFPPLPYRDAHLRSIADGVDLIVVSQGANCDGLEWIEAARATGHNYAVVSHSAVPYWWPDDDRAERAAKVYENASASYFVSKAVLELTRQQIGSALPRGKVVRNPFNVPYDVRPCWPTPDEGLAAAHVGRVDLSSKAQDLLLQVLSLPHWRCRNIRVSLFGEGPNERGLRRLADQLNLRNVSFCGQSNDIEGIWAKHHALVLPSRFEGMPLVLVEAMLCGRPCIATDVGGNAELIRDGINGFLAKAATVESFDEAMNRAWENRHRLRCMGEQAATDVRQWVSPDPGADFAGELAALIGDNREVPRPNTDPSFLSQTKELP